MTRRRLIYRWDDQAGRMRLRGAGVRLRSGDRTMLENALTRRYESLIAELERGGTEPTIFSAWQHCVYRDAGDLAAI